MSDTDRRLGISPTRRVIGAGFVLGMYAVSIAAFVWPNLFGRLATANSPLLPSDTPVMPLVVLACAIILSPYILLPCIFDRFPKWMYSLHTDPELRRMAKWFFGAARDSNYPGA